MIDMWWKKWQAREEEKKEYVEVTGFLQAPLTGHTTGSLLASPPPSPRCLCLFPTDMRPYHILTVLVRERAAYEIQVCHIAPLSIGYKDIWVSTVFQHSSQTAAPNPLTAIISPPAWHHLCDVCVCVCVSMLLNMPAHLWPTCWYMDHLIFMVELGHNKLVEQFKELDRCSKAIRTDSINVAAHIIQIKC